MFIINNGYIAVSHYCEDNRARPSTGIRIGKGKIDRDKLKKSEQMLLSRVEAAVIRFLESKARLEEPVLKKEFEAMVYEAVGKKFKGKTALADFETMISDMGSGKRLNPKNNQKYTSSTIINYQSALTYVKRYCEEKKTAFTYSITPDWIKGFVGWLTAENYSKNSIAFAIGNIGSFLNHMKNDGKHKSNITSDRAFNLDREDADSVALTVSEINELYKLTLPPHLERARDVFIFGCWVGLRSKDLKDINKYIPKGDFFEFQTSKTGVRVIVPIHPMAKSIHEKYSGNMPIFRFNNNLNDHINSVCKMAGISDPCLVTMTKGGKKTWEYYPKHEMVSIHSARRSFATNAYMAGVLSRKIMKITGHTTESSFRKYIRIDNQENAEDLAKHPFFKS